MPGVPGVYAAGDTAAAETEGGHRTMPSCQHALPLGRFAGHNVAADLLGLPPVPFAPDPYVTCLDLGSAGAVFTTGWDRRVKWTGETAKARKRTVNEDWIYPCGQRRRRDPAPRRLPGLDPPSRQGRTGLIATPAKAPA